LKPRDRLKSINNNLLRESRRKLKKRSRRTWLRRKSSSLPLRRPLGRRSSKNKWRKA